MIVMGAVNEGREGGWEDLVTAQKSWNSVRGRVAHVLMGYADTQTHTRINMCREKMMAIWMGCDSL